MSDLDNQEPGLTSRGRPDSPQYALDIREQNAEMTKGREMSTGSIGLTCAFCLMLSLLLPRSMLWSTNVVVRDFTGFLVGAKLLGTSRLYDIAANLATQRAIIGRSARGVIYVRPPFFAAVLKPFTWLPYAHALIVWELLLVGAAVAFVLVFPFSSRRYTALAVCASLPLSIAFFCANDVPFILLWIALALVSWRKGRGLLTGVLLALCLPKFHFFVFLPLLLWHREYRRVLLGFLSAASLLIGVNFIVQPDWMRLYWQALHMPQRNMNSTPESMPNIYASFFWTGHPVAAVVFGALLIAAILWPICQHLPFDVALPFCILGGLLASPHTNSADGLLMIPALLLVAVRYPQWRLLACFLLSPLAACLYCFWPSVGPALVVAAVLWLLYGVRRYATDVTRNSGVLTPERVHAEPVLVSVLNRSQ